jgi:Zn-dependent protease with chaperone function
MFPIIMLSNKESAEIFNCSEELCRKSSLMVGGFCAMNITQEIWDQYSAALGSEEKTGNLFTKGLGSYVIVNTDIVEKAGFIGNELQAILSHEQAHLEFDHLGGCTLETGILVNASFEIEADQYASNLFGKDVVASALRKIIKVVVDETVEVMGVPFDVANKKLNDDPILLQRFAALV